MVSVINRTKWVLNIPDLKKETEKMLDFLSREMKDRSGDIRLAYVTEAEMISLHERYLGSAEVTDVLSFEDRDESGVSGDIAVCPDAIYDSVTDSSPAFSYLNAEVILHGLLHLFGYNHDYNENTLRDVYNMQKNILDSLNLNWRTFEFQKKTG